MTKRKLKKYVKPTIFMVCISIITISIMLMTKDLKTTNEPKDQTYVMNAVIDSITPVVNDTETIKIIKPFTSDKVVVNKPFYEKDASNEEQQNALIYYENTYLQNSGVVYSSNEEFDCVSVLDGTIVDIKQDDILNTVVYVSHDNNITTIYYGLKDVSLKVNDQISQGQLIGKSNNNKFCSESNSILFEVNNNGQVINPEQFYNANLNELN